MTDLTRTQEALVREAAELLNIVGTGQSLEADYAEKISSRVDSLFAQLAADGICNVAAPSAIPVEWFDALAGLLANISASIAGKTFDPQIKEYYEMQLRRLTSSGPSYRVLDTEYF
jgi:hypothetical protein